MTAVSAFQTAFDRLLWQAYHNGASDIHLEPMGEGLRIRMRVDGELRLVDQVDEPARASRFLEVCKQQCQLDVGVLGLPQDVRFGTEQPPCDYRVALVPGLDGEKFVLRLLRRDVQLDLDAYPMPEIAKEALRGALGKRDGILVVSGPTGSGKTTLLYNALHALDASQQAIYTLEDPVEYRLAGLHQSQVDRRRGVGFAELLRALMRADPDVLLVGEIRDPETAEAAFHAAKTGHLVLTTVHATDVEGIGRRLEDLGVSPESHATTVQFASAQRLLPRLCPSCRQPDPDGADRLQVAFPDLEVRQAWRGAGCEACEGRGVKGRVLLMGWQTRVPTTEGRSALDHCQSLRQSIVTAAAEGEIRVRDALAL